MYPFLNGNLACQAAPYPSLMSPLLLQNHFRRILAAQNILKNQFSQNFRPETRSARLVTESETINEPLQIPETQPLEKIMDLDVIYGRVGLSRELITGGTPEELLQPPVKSVGFRTETQIKLMRKMRHVANKLNLTQVNLSKQTNPRAKMTE